MRSPLDLPSRLIKDAELYAPGRKGSDAVEWILEDYPRRVREIRELRSQHAFSNDQLDQLVTELQSVCRRILDL